jgi:sec-independent protein translocase protein TatC
MLLTPPDVISQTLLALPMWVLFEAGVIFSRFFVRNREQMQAAQQEPAMATAAAGASATAGNSAPVEEAFEPLSQEEMEAELDRIEAELDEEEASWHEEPEPEEKPALDPVDAKLVRVNELREAMDFSAARKLLYEVLVEGNEEQVRTARNILDQLDD